MIFRLFFLHVVTFSHVLHLDVIRSQIELKLKVKTEISLCMVITQYGSTVYIGMAMGGSAL